MNVIFVNRKIFNKLKSNEQLTKEYIYNNIEYADMENKLLGDYSNLTDGIFSMISKNEALIEKVGMKNYYHSNYELQDHVESCWHRTGQYGLIAFDWSMGNETDTEWDYSFNVFKIL